MIPYLFLLLLGPESEVVQSRTDSLIIYRAYKESIEVLKNTSDPERWYAYEDSLSRATACSFLRLSKFNKVTYQHAIEFNKEGMGVAFSYPKPSDAWLEDLRAKRQPTVPKVELQAKAPVAEPLTVPIEKKEVGPVAFTVLDHQTHFMVTNNGKTKTPYIELYHYAKGRVLVKVEKINPITLKPIEIPAAPEVKQTAFMVSAE
ncbi:MAG: hypothetical protein V4615_11155 [Bacteroidota bacterium]